MSTSAIAASTLAANAANAASAAIQKASLNWLVPPILKSYGSDEWFNFLDQFRDYKIQGGPAKLTTLISPDVGGIYSMRLLKLNVDFTKADDEDIVLAITSFYIPTDAIAIMEGLRNIQMHNANNGFNEKELYSFIQRFQTYLKRIPKAAKLDPIKTRETFVKNLRPLSFRDRIDSLSPKTWEDAMEYCFEVAEKIRNATKTLEGLEISKNNFKHNDKMNTNSAKNFMKTRISATGSPRSSTGHSPTPPSTAVSTNKTPVASPIKVRCHGCGHPDHTRPKCPNKDVPGYMSEGIRHQPIQLKLNLLELMSIDEDEEESNVNLKAYINGNSEIAVLLDTGATANFIPSNLLDGNKPIDITPISVNTANGSMLINQKVTINMKLDKQEDYKILDFYIFPDSCKLTYAIIGFPSIKNHGLLNHLLNPIDSKIELVLQKYPNIFADDLPGAKVDPMHINLTQDAKPIAVPPRRCAPAIRKVIQETTNELLDQNIIRPSSSPYCSPIVMVKQKDKFRMVVDYREVNKMIVPEHYPLPNNQELLSRMNGSKIFGKLDLKKGFYQIPLDEDSRYITAFSTPDCQYEFTRVPMGNRNAPSFFQRAMTEIFTEYIGRFIEIFIDDIIIYSQNEIEFLNHLELVLKKLNDYNFRVKKEKCSFGLNSIDYLGFIVSGNGISISPTRCIALKNITEPKTTKQIRSFMGLANFFRKFIPDFAKKSIPLNRLCSKNTPFVWNESCQQAFKYIKEDICNSPILHHINYNNPIYLRTDASSAGIGAMLYQIIDDHPTPILYISKAFNEQQRNWSTIESEAYAVYFAIISCESYLLGHHFIVETDHRNLEFINKSIAPKIVRWRLRLELFDFEIKHIPGRDNTIADCLSRCLAIQDDNSSPKNNNDNSTPQSSFSAKEKLELLGRCHNEIVGHFGLSVTKQNLESLLQEQNKSWDGNINKDVNDYIKSCSTCQKFTNHKQTSDHQKFSTKVQTIFEQFEIDHITGLPIDADGNQYLLVIMDNFSRFTGLFPCKTLTAEEAVGKLLIFISFLGIIPKRIHSDQGKAFTSKFFQEFLEIMKITPKFSMEYNHQQNGLIERRNKEVLRHLRNIVFDRNVINYWSYYVPFVQRILNNIKIKELQDLSPTELIFGIHSQDSIELKKSSNYGDIYNNLSSIQKVILQTVNSVELQQPNVINQEYPVDSLVLAYNPDRPHASKLKPIWKGPFKIISYNNEYGVYTVLDESNSLSKENEINYHSSHLKAYNSDRTPNINEIAGKDYDETVVDKISAHTGSIKRKTAMKFLVHYTDGTEGWLPYINVRNLAAFEEYIKLNDMNI